MAITILERPEGQILDATENTATVSESYGAGDAQFVAVTTHGLVDGDYIYAESDIEDYAGFWYVDAISTGIFKIKQYADGDYVQFIASGSITWRKSILSHGWSAVHLPITYRISNTLYPVNATATRTVGSVGDVNGWTVLNLLGPIVDPNSFDFITLTVPNDTELTGVYQIIEMVSSSVLIINLAYDSSNDLTSATAQKYYNNYNVLVRVYAGINASHEWALQKPYELAVTLKLIPDNNNEVFFSINEVLKSYVQTRNNLGLGTLPNNIDFWTNFYIETAESYDDSDGYTFGTFTSSFTSDQSNFEGVAVNADLEFKNLYSGYLSEYILPIKWLMLFDELSVYADQYFDISFLNALSNYTLGYRVNGTDYSFTNESGIGVYRFTPTFSPSATQLSVYVTAQSIAEQPENNTFTSTISPWYNSGSGTSWVANANMARVTLSAGATSANLNAYRYYLFANVTYDIQFDYAVGVTDPGSELRIYGISPGQPDELLYSLPLVGASGTITASVTSSQSHATFAFGYFNNAASPSALDIDNVILSITSVAGIGEELVININQDCYNDSIDLQWLNNLGGFDQWRFTAKKDHIVEIQEALVTKKNIFPTWPKSYGATADTIRKQTSRTSNKAYTIRAQHLTRDQADAISYIKSSVLVQIVNSRNDRRTILVDTESFVKYQDQEKLYTIAFNVSFTDDIPSQTA